MRKISIFVFVALTGISLTCCSVKPDQDSYAAPYMKGISNEGKTNNKPYLTAGDKAHIIGLQNGQFPDMGGHVRYESGGVWSDPIKLADGYWLKVSEKSVPDGVWLMDADEFITYPEGSEFVYKNKLNGLQVNRFQFAPDQERGVIIDYTITNNSDVAQNLVLDFVMKTDLTPVWLSKEHNILDYSDLITWDNDNKLFSTRDSVQNWFMAWGTDSPVLSYVENYKGPVETFGKGIGGLIQTSVTVAPKEKKVVSFAVSGSIISNAEAVSTYNRLLKQKKEMLVQKQNSFAELLEVSKITIPDKRLETTYNWVKINNRWLELDLDGYGRFLCAGAIEYPWLFGCDNSYALQGVLATGDFELAKSTLTQLRNASEKENGNGRIIHEMSTNGFIYNKGNTQETAHFIGAVWKTFLWTGDIAFLQDMYPYVKKGINWLLVDMDTNGNLFPEGYGIMEVTGLAAELIDAAVYTQQALEATSCMAKLFNEIDLANEYAAKATILKDKINTEFWDETEGSYCDFYGTKEQAISVANGALKDLERNTSATRDNINIDFYKRLIANISNLPAGTQHGWFTNKNWVINTPVETGIAPVDKAIRLLDKVRNEHCGEYGPYLSGVEKQAMMTISTGTQAVSEAQYGRTDECLWYLDKIASTLSRTFPGSINEMMPDYGCPVQAWTIYSVAVPVITHVFGISPDAYNKKVVISPSLPSQWNEIKLENQKVGSNSYDLQVSKSDGKTTYVIKSREKDWNNVLRIKGLSGQSYELNGKAVHATSDDIALIGAENTICWKSIVE
ncbi:hypothetical protein FACS1894181_13490 [Bacteroidia bacterium]|nr:hypothetical protein FACS1894181_13490 [Bacteroidia bacterium]